MVNKIYATIGFLISLFAITAQAQIEINKTYTETPLSFQQGKQRMEKSVSLVNSMNLPELALESLRNNVFAKTNGVDVRKSLQFAVPYSVGKTLPELSLEEIGEYQSKDYAVYRLEISSPNAKSINIGFSEFYLPPSASLFIYNEKSEIILGPYTKKDNDAHGQFWTPNVAENKLFLELNVAKEEADQVKLTIGKVNQAYLDFYNLEAEIELLKSGSCNVDVACSQADDWRDQVNSVGVYTVNGIFTCTGAAVHNQGDLKGYFLTAAHCDVTATNAASVVVYWKFENSTCRVPGSSSSGQTGDGSLYGTYPSIGTVHRATYFQTDVTLLEFDDPLPADANVFLAGWSNSTSTPSSAVGIHHPQTEEKRISFENDPLSLDRLDLFGLPFVPNTHLRVNDWDLGTTEPGSSGSPLFDSNKRVVGQLSGGLAACGNNESDYYGRFAVSWNGGGTSSTRLKDWLDPDNTGATTLDGAFYNDLIEPDSFEDDNLSGNATAINIGEEQEHSIHTMDDVDWYSFTLTEETTGITITTSGPLGGDTVLELYDDNEQLIAINDDASSTLYSRIDQILGAGTYYFRVHSYNMEYPIALYNISLTDGFDSCDFFTIPFGNNNAVIVCL